MPLLPSDWKATCRKQATARRKQAQAQQPLAPARAAALFLSCIPLEQDSIIALYHPFGSELDTAPLAQKLTDQGRNICLPVVTGRKDPLSFRRHEPGRKLIEGDFGILTPPETAPICRPDVILVPLLAFARNGARLGMGGGFYDRSLSHLRAGNYPVTAIGYAYSAQEMTGFPEEAHDARLDAVITDLDYIPVIS